MDELYRQAYEEALRLHAQPGRYGNQHPAALHDHAKYQHASATSPGVKEAIIDFYWNYALYFAVFPIAFIIYLNAEDLLPPAQGIALGLLRMILCIIKVIWAIVYWSLATIFGRDAELHGQAAGEAAAVQGVTGSIRGQLVRLYYFSVYHPFWIELYWAYRHISDWTWRQLKKVLIASVIVWALWRLFVSSGTEEEAGARFVSMEQAAGLGYEVPWWVSSAARGQRSNLDKVPYVVDEWVGAGIVRDEEAEMPVGSFDEDALLSSSSTNAATAAATETEIETETITITVSRDHDDDHTAPSVSTVTTTITEREILTVRALTRTEVSTSTVFRPTIIANVTPTTRIFVSTVRAPERTITISGDGAGADVTTSWNERERERGRGQWRQIEEGLVGWCARCRQRHGGKVEE